MNSTDETFETWNNIAQLYEEKFMQLDLYNHTYDEFCEVVKLKHPKILELGCGPGNITRYMLQKRPDFDMLGLDVSSNMINLAVKNNATAKFEVMDVRNLNQLTGLYDGIVSGFCIPYLSQDELQIFINDVSRLLIKNGAFYLSFVEGNSEQSGFQSGSGGRVFFNYYPLVQITKWLTKSGFALHKQFLVNYKNEIHTIIIACKS